MQGGGFQLLGHTSTALTLEYRQAVAEPVLWVPQWDLKGNPTER